MVGHGSLAEWFKALVLKTSRVRPQWFESTSFRHVSDLLRLSWWAGAEETKTMDTCPRGLRSRPGKSVWSNCHHRFESCSIRHARNRQSSYKGIST
jgi:hypothetical protein